MKPPEPGVYPDTTREEYDSWEAGNHSSLVKFNQSAAHALEYRTHPPPPTQALHLGQAVHQAVLEPLVFDDEWIMGPLAADGVNPLGRRSNVDKAQWAAFESENTGKGILTSIEWRQCQALRTSAWNHPVARELLGDHAGINELSCTYEDPDTEMPCKMRMDRLTEYQGQGAIVELKTAVNGARFAFGRQAANMGYLSQAYQYWGGLRSIPGGDTPRRFFWIVVEKTAPFVCAVYEATVDALDAGYREYQRQILAYAEVMKTDVWPGYNTEIEPVWVPKWAGGPTTEEGGI